MEHLKRNMEDQNPFVTCGKKMIELYAKGLLDEQTYWELDKLIQTTPALEEYLSEVEDSIDANGELAIDLTSEMENDLKSMIDRFAKSVDDATEQEVCVDEDNNMTNPWDLNKNQANIENSIITNLPEINPYKDLRDIDDVHEASESERLQLEKLVNFMKEKGLIEHFGITLLHKHFEVNDDEILIESCDLENRTLSIKPIKKSMIAKSEAFNTLQETQWKSNGLACALICINTTSKNSLENPPDESQTFRIIGLGVEQKKAL